MAAHAHPGVSGTSRRLRAGPLSLLFEEGGIRDVHHGELEVLRGVYAAARDRNWDTPRPAISNLTVQAGVRSFRIAYDAAVRADEIDLGWRAVLFGERDGTIRFSIAGSARGACRVNRVGFCVLHPPSCAGLECRIRHTDGSEESALFPLLIAPHQPFRDVLSITHHPAPGLEVSIRFGGDVFETEDQRNWTDASFKTYSRPLDLPCPYWIQAGTAVSQAIELRIAHTGGAAPLRRVRGPIAASGGVAHRLIRVGVAAADAGLPTSDRVLEWIRGIRPAHLRLELPPGAAGLERALPLAEAVDAPLEMVVSFGEDPVREAERVVDRIAGRRLTVARWIVLSARAETTPAGLLPEVRPVLVRSSPEARFYAGTDGYFADLNRACPPLEASDGLAYSMNPQVHASDDRTLFENLEGQAATVQSARELSGGRDVVVSPVTLRPRSNPDAGDDRLRDAAEGDPRQRTLLGAAWTLGSIRALSLAGATSATYHEIVGSRGLMSSSGVFPVYFVLALACEHEGATLLPEPEAAPGIISLHLATPRGSRLLVANSTPGVWTLRLARAAGRRSLRLLDGANAASAAANPRSWLDAPTDCPRRLRLPPYAFAVIDEARRR